MSDVPLRFAVIGCGALAQGTHLPNLVKSNQAVLSVCCDASEQTLEHCQQAFSPERVMPDWREVVADSQVDAICLATTEKLRLPVIEAAVKAGKPVYVEKPLARSLEEMYRIQQIVREAGVPVCVGHNRRSSPAMRDAYAIFRGHMQDPKPCSWRWNREPQHRPDLPEDKLGSINIRVNDDWHSWKAWVFDREHAPHGPMLFEMTHFTDLCNWLLDAEPAEVFAMESGMLVHAITIRYATGEMATLHMSANGTFGYPKELYEMMGRGGMVVVDHMLEVRTAGIVDAPTYRAYPVVNDRYPEIGQQGGLLGYLEKQAQACRDAVDQENPQLTLHGGPDKGHAHQLERFIEEVRGVGPKVCPVDDAVLATRVAFAAICSAAEGRIVRMDEI